MADTAWQKGLHPKAVEAVEQTLAPDEEVRLVIHGASKQAIIATDSRALVYKKGFMAGASFGAELTSWAYRNVLGVQIHTGMMSGAVVLQAPGQSGTRTSSWKGDDADPYKAPNAIPLNRPFDGARRRVARLGQIIDEAHRREQAPVAASPAQESVADELRKLADLRAEGVLTDQEFADLKAKLLA
ncbi:MAG TPA: SHOCT domain-containing protein [Nocardioides sp.]|uniref:SHOCT domain-containing protein n=1 Tax=Nocardioides sp. TaxID=35761 RepID=UPI002F4248E6